MSDLQENLAIYNNPLNFIVKFTAPSVKDIYKSFIIEEKLHKALTFNFKNSYIKAGGEIIVGNFKYDDSEKLLKIEINNPSVDGDTEIEITIATNITNLAAVIESNYIVTNMAYIKIKGYEDVDELITKSNLIDMRFNSVKIEISAKPITKIVPAIDGQSITVEASFNTLDTNADYDIIVRNNLGENLAFEDIKSYIAVDGVRVDSIQFMQEENTVSVNIHNSNEIRNKKIDIIISSKIQNANNINDALINEFNLNINNVDCSKDAIEIQLIKPISTLTNTLISK